jgi:hypothetical protein
MFYDEMQKIASDVLKDFKQGVIKYIDIVPTSGPADEPGAPTVVEYELDAVAKGVSYKFVKDGLALSTDLTVTSAVLSGLTPNLRGFIEIDGNRYKIVQDISTPAAGTRAVWKWIVRKG